MPRPLLDSEIEAKIRAMALARRRLSREIKRLNELAAGATLPDGTTSEVDRLVLLSRGILDSAGRSLGILPASAEPEAADPSPAAPASKEPIPSPADEKPPTAEHQLALQGHARWFLAPDLIAYLGSVRKSGVLRISTASEVFTMEFSGGDIVHCESTRPSSGQRLGDILISQGALDRPTLEAQLATPSTERMGARLLSAGIINREQLDAALRTQVQVLFCHLCREEARGFTFWVGPAMFAAGGIRLSAISLLLEATRVNDEVADRLSWLEDHHAR